MRPLKFKKGKNNLLKKAFDELLKIFPSEQLVNKFCDEFGIYALETKSFILTAKDYIYNGIVSAHSQAVHQAWVKGKPLLMFIGREHKFLQFNPEKLLENSFLNIRGSITMINFDVKLAEKVYGNSTNLEAWLR